MHFGKLRRVQMASGVLSVVMQFSHFFTLCAFLLSCFLFHHTTLLFRAAIPSSTLVQQYSFLALPNGEVSHCSSLSLRCYNRTSEWIDYTMQTLFALLPLLQTLTLTVSAAAVGFVNAVNDVQLQSALLGSENSNPYLVARQQSTQADNPRCGPVNQNQTCGFGLCCSYAGFCVSPLVIRPRSLLTLLRALATISAASLKTVKGIMAFVTPTLHLLAPTLPAIHAVGQDQYRTDNSSSIVRCHRELLSLTMMRRQTTPKHSWTF